MSTKERKEVLSKELEDLNTELDSFKKDAGDSKIVEMFLEFKKISNKFNSRKYKMIMKKLNKVNVELNSLDEEIYEEENKSKKKTK